MAFHSALALYFVCCAAIALVAHCRGRCAVEYFGLAVMVGAAMVDIARSFGCSGQVIAVVAYVCPVLVLLKAASRRVPQPSGSQSSYSSSYRR